MVIYTRDSSLSLGSKKRSFYDRSAALTRVVLINSIEHKNIENFLRGKLPGSYCPSGPRGIADVAIVPLGSVHVLPAEVRRVSC